MNYDIHTGLLKMLDNFNRKDVRKANFTYCHNHPKLIELADKYNLKQIAGSGGELTQVLNLLHWLSANVYHYDAYAGSVPLNALDMLNYSFGKGHECGINCQSLATTLTECYLSLGFKARTIYIMPFNPFDTDNHVVSVVYISALGKWIMADPSFSAYMMDESGTILSPWEARKILENQGKITLNDEFNYNGSTDKWTAEEFTAYIAKDLFFFHCGESSTFDANPFDPSKGIKMLTLAPVGFDVKKFMIENAKWRIRHYGESEGRLRFLAETEKMEINYVSYEDFIANP